MPKFVGPSYDVKRRKADVQRSINLMPTPIESGTGKTDVYLAPVPGLVVFAAEAAEAESAYVPYLWIGARVNHDDSPNPYDGYMNLVVMEPATEGGTPPGMLSTHPVFESVAPAESISRWFVADQAVPQDEFGGEQSYRPVIETTDSGLYRVMDDFVNVAFPEAGMTDSSGDPITAGAIGGVTAPFDPYVGVEALRTYVNGNPLAAWSQVVVLDPNTSLQPTDSRSLLQIADMQTLFGITTEVKPGLYVVKIGNFEACLAEPMSVQIRVHLGKVPNVRTFEFDIDQATAIGTSYPRLCAPYGNDFELAYYNCDWEIGNNPHSSSSWWQGALLIDVENGTCERVDDVYVPPFGFVAEAWNVNRDVCTTGGVPKVFVSSYVPTSNPWISPVNLLPDAFAMCVRYVGTANPWGEPPFALPGTIDPVTAEQLEYIKANAAAGVEPGKVYEWTGQALLLVGPEPAGAFVEVVGIIPNPTNTTWSDPLAAMAWDQGYPTCVVMLIGLQQTGYTNPTPTANCA